MIRIVPSKTVAETTSGFGNISFFELLNDNIITLLKLKLGRKTKNDNDN